MYKALSNPCLSKSCFKVASSKTILNIDVTFQKKVEVKAINSSNLDPWGHSSTPRCSSRALLTFLRALSQKLACSFSSSNGRLYGLLKPKVQHTAMCKLLDLWHTRVNGLSRKDLMITDWMHVEFVWHSDLWQWVDRSIRTSTAHVQSRSIAQQHL